jgi:putative protease
MQGLTGTATGPVVETARTRPVTAEEVAEHVGRLGGTPYRIGEVSVRIDADAGVSFSELHRLRREAVARLDDARLRPWAGRAVSSHPPRLDPPADRPGSAHAPAGIAPALVVVVRDAAAARACRKAGADRVLVVDPDADCAETGTGRLLDRVVHEVEFDAVMALADCAGPAVAGNLGVLRARGEAGRLVEADWGLNVLNPWSVSALAGMGASAVWASPELDGRQLADLVSSSSLPIGVVVGGRTELMVAEHCVLQAAGPCAHACASCSRRREQWTLLDRKGYRMPVTTDAAGRAHIYNAVPLDLSRSIGELLDAGVSALRLEMQTASNEEAVAVTKAWRKRIDGAVRSGQLPLTPIIEPSTTGHFYRGVR